MHMPMQAMQALSHYSYHTSGGQVLLCDLQGGILPDGSGIVLTDPVILSRDRSYGVTDLGPEGMSTFFSRHVCNVFCHPLWKKSSDKRAYFGAYAGTSMLVYQSNVARQPAGVARQPAAAAVEGQQWNVHGCHCSQCRPVHNCPQMSAIAV